MTRAGQSGQRALAAAIVLATPLLAGPYFPSCARSHGVYPTLCSPGGQGSCPADPPSGQLPAAQLDQVEQALQQAEVTSVVNIGALADWNALEQCIPFEDPSKGTLVFTGANPALPQQTIYCYRNIGALQIWLRKFVAAQDPSDPNCDGGRVGIINLAPIFSHENKLPAYLLDRRFNDTSTDGVIDRFKDLWDEVLVELSDSRYVNAPDDRASWMISIGNEIGMYLNDRHAAYPTVDGTTTTCPSQDPGTCYGDPPSRWTDYREFYEAVAPYVRSTAQAAGIPISIGTTERWGRQAGDDVCGPWVLNEQYAANMDCTYLTPSGSATVLRDEAIWAALAHLSMAAVSDIFIYTRYHPRFLGEPPGTSMSTLRSQLQADLTDHFTQMGTWSDLATAWGVTPGDLAIVIQEISYPSAYDSGNGLADLAAHDIAYQQGPFASDTFAMWNAYNDAAESAQMAPILSMNWFNLHDFPSAFCDANTGGIYFPFCAWGLLTNDHELKQTGEPFLTSSWAYYVLTAIGQNPASSDPARCF